MNASTKYPGLPEWLDKYDLNRVEWKGVAGYFGILPVAKVSPNTGQVPGLPSNPRRWTKDEMDRLKRSVEETPELMLGRGVLAYPTDTELVALGGNMRHAAAKALKEKTLPVFVFPSDTNPDKLMEIVAKDNGSFGEWDFDALANEWSDKPLTAWGIPAWNPESAVGGEGAEGPGGKDGKDGKEPEGFDLVVRFQTAEDRDRFAAVFADQVELAGGKVLDPK